MYSFPTLPALLATRVLNRPLVWSPRGALKEWIGTKNKSMKATWRKMCRAILAPEKTVLHVTSSEEELETRLRMPGIPCVRIPNGVEIPELSGAREWIPNGELRLLSMGRLDPIKGLENLIAALRHLRAPRFSLRIFGTGDPGYQASLETLAAEHGVRESISFLGPASGELKRSAFLSSDVCVVPSFSENFGMVIAESLAHGTPVIASTGTPWQIVQTANIGRWVPNDPVALANAIDSLRGEDLASMGKRAREVMKSEFAWPTVAARMLAAYKALQA
jgi:glycosyltransferase involved in cell wall biosynthesis